MKGMSLVTITLAAGISLASVAATCHRVAQAEGWRSVVHVQFEDTLFPSSANGAECCVIEKHVQAFPPYVAVPLQQVMDSLALGGLLLVWSVFAARVLLTRIREVSVSVTFASVRVPITPAYLRNAFSSGTLHPKIYPFL
ncbi:MAG: hypothetical protein AB1352_03135 [Patescibacteria group bacterium]